jgi:hypothetical protein
MRRITFGLFALATLAAPSVASATTVIIYTDPMTFTRHTVVYDTPGPDRAFLCMLPPGEGSCHSIPFNRKN